MSLRKSVWVFWYPSRAHRGVCVQAKAASPCLTSLCLPAFPGLNPDQACLDLSLLAHNQGAGEGDGAVGIVRRHGGRRGEDAEKVTLTLTCTFIPLFTPSVNRLYRESIHSMEEGWSEKYEAGEVETRRKQRIKERERESSTICKKCKKGSQH